MNGPDALDFGRASVTNIGNPHCVLAVADVAALKLEPLGKGIVRPLPSQRDSLFHLQRRPRPTSPIRIGAEAAPARTAA